MSKSRTLLAERACVCASLLLLAGCSAGGDGPPPLLREAAAQTRAGEQAYLAGRAGEAVPALGEAVRLHLSAGDLPGAARALLNLALAQRAAGDATAAGATAARLTELTPAACQQAAEQGAATDAIGELTTATAWLEALLALDAGDMSAASSRLAAASGKFPGASPWPGRVATLRAEVALAQGRFDEALTQARLGQAASVAAHERAEEARARRFAGMAHLKLGHWPEARVEFLAAVRIEEQLGGGHRMAGDLTQLAVIARQLGDAAAAELFDQRARAITAVP